MSAYLCHDDTFDYLGSAGAKFTRGQMTHTIYIRPEMPDVPELIAAGILEPSEQRLILHCDGPQVAAVLRFQNARSVTARYTNAPECERPYTYRSVPTDYIGAVEALKTIACVEYQSCETDDYQETFAYALLMALKHAAVNALPGYEKAPWGWTRPERLTRGSKEVSVSSFNLPTV